MPKQTHEIEETAILNDADDFQEWCEELRTSFEEQAEYPESVTVSMEWEAAEDDCNV